MNGRFDWTKHVDGFGDDLHLGDGTWKVMALVELPSVGWKIQLSSDISSHSLETRLGLAQPTTQVLIWHSVKGADRD